jgi:hypothetical protein
MLRPIAALIGILAVAAPALAKCPFCGGETRSRLTLRMQFAQAKVVAFGQLRNARVDPKTDEGFTDLQVVAVLKDDPIRAGRTTITLHSYLPVIGNGPANFLVFCGSANDKLDPTFGLPASPAVVEYLTAAAKLDGKDPVALLGFFFKHLDSADPAVAADAFAEFARASDADITRAAKQLDPARIRKLIANPATPVERLGVLAFLLGVSGGPSDAPFLAGMLKESPISDRSTAAFGGLLAGYILLNPRDGWPYAAAVLGDARQSYAVRLSAIGAVRFFQSSRGNECKPELLRCCAALLPHGDFADQAIEDLRRWGYWDLTGDVLSLYAKPSHSAPIVRRCIVRYALSCPDEQAKRFIATVRQQDVKLVQSVEQTLDLYAPLSNSSTTPKKQP